MNKPNQKTNRRVQKQSSAGKLFAGLKRTALSAGPTKLFMFGCLIALAFGALAYYQYIAPQTAANDTLQQTLTTKRKQNAIARMVQETKPQFIEEFRRLINNYGTARELLPGEAEVSNVLDAVQQIARANQVRVTMFDASKPGAKSNASPNDATAAQSTGAAPAPPQISLNERLMPAQVQGTHANIARFLTTVARYPRIIYVRDFSITSLNRQETMSMTLVTYDAPTSGILPPIPAELREEFQNQTAQLAPK